MDPLLSFHDGSHLVISTKASKDGSFACALYTMLIAANDDTAYRMLSTQFEAETCLKAQDYAYKQATHLYPSVAQKMKQPPYLIWQGPRT
jgi:hypothetical protein